MANTITILGNKYNIIEVPFGLKKRLNDNFNKNVKIKELTDTDLLIQNLIGKYAINKLKRHVRFYSINILTEKIDTILNRKLGNTELTVREVFSKLYEKNIKVFLKGGIVRDIFINVDSIDVDAIFDSNVTVVKNICDAEGWSYDNLYYKFQSMNIGGAKGISIDLVNLNATFMSSDIDHEFTINDLVFDFRANLLIDVSGYGLFDVINKTIRISPTPNLYNKWAINDWKKPLRYFKLLMKGFKPMTSHLHKFIIKYIENNLDTVYFKIIYEDVSRIKHFLIKNITNGIINTDGTYEYGVNKKAIMAYLIEMKKHISKDTFMRIISVLRVTSHDKYLTNVVNKVSYKKKKTTQKINYKDLYDTSSASD
jgi:hypothetical protein